LSAIEDDPMSETPPSLSLGHAERGYRFAGFTFDPVSGVLIRPDGSRARLRPKAVEVLCALVESGGQLLSREALMALVWPNVVVTDDSITQCVTEIRRAAGSKAFQILRTFPRRGYQFVCHDVSIGPTPKGRCVTSGGADEETVQPKVCAWPDRPSIVVLPFANLSGDPAQEYFSDGVTDDIVAQLARDRSLFVIARASGFSFRSRSVSMRDIARELGVRYVLEGSVRRESERVRINARLVEAETAIHIWAEHYDRTLTDVFAVQDEITRAVVTEIAPAITQAERERALRKPTTNLTAWEAYQRGLWHTSGGGNSDSDLGAAFFRRAVELDPLFAEPHAMLARFHNGEATRGGGRPLDDGLKLAEAEARAALRLDVTNASAHTALAWVFNQRCDVASALEQAERAISLNRNDPMGYLAKGHVLVFAGRHDEARSALGDALRLDPKGQTVPGALHHIAISFYLDREYASAEIACRKGIRAHPDFPRTYPYLAATLGQLGRQQEACEAMQKTLSVAPVYLNFLTSDRPPWYRPGDHDHLIDGLRKAGWSAPNRHL
jgi:adenylate cyclase